MSKYAGGWLPYKAWTAASSVCGSKKCEAGESSDVLAVIVAERAPGRGACAGIDKINGSRLGDRFNQVHGELLDAYTLSDTGWKPLLQAFGYCPSEGIVAADGITNPNYQ